MAEVVVIHGKQGFELLVRRQVGYAGQVAPLAQAAQLPGYQRRAQVILTGKMVVNGGRFHAQFPSQMLVAERIEATLKQKRFRQVENARTGVRNKGNEGLD